MEPLNPASGPAGPPAAAGQPHEQELFDQAHLHQLSHDLRTPLTVIVGYSELLRAGSPRPDQQQAVDAMLAAGINLSAVIEHLLERAGVQRLTSDPGSVMTAMYRAPSAVPGTGADRASLRGRRTDRGTNPEEPGPRRPESQERLAGALRIPGSALDSLDPDVMDVALARIDSLSQELRAARSVAGIDPFTGRILRSAGEAALRHAMDRSFRVDEPLLLAMVVVGDEPSGGEGPLDVPDTLGTALRDDDPVIHYSSNEFMCILENAELREHRHRFDEVADQLSLNDRVVSIGLAQLAGDDSLESFVQRARSAAFNCGQPDESGMTS